ncbi:MAG: UDP-N-acetylmuramate dehydrogenase [Coraliomargarita sp.]
MLGVGGMGMAPLAAWMAHAGYSVCGYDDNLQEQVRRFLVDSSVELQEFVFAEHLRGYDVVVHSSALQEDHPLLVAARAYGLKVLRRGEMLAHISAEKRLVAVVGSHGKTTTSGMIAYALRTLNCEVDYILGGFFNGGQLPPCQFTSGEWLVAEVDESDGTIDDFVPEITVILNIDWDHADRYETVDMLDTAFRQLVSRTSGTVFVPQESGLAARFAESTQVQIHEFALGSGGFNVANRSAALAVLESLPIGPVERGVLDGFPGIARRQTILLESPKLTIYEDYAHHPTEIEALLQELGSQHPGNRLVVVFQSHRYTRTQQFKSEFAAALGAADELFLLPVYAAHETKFEGGRVDDLVEEFEEAPPILSMDLDGAGELAEAVQAGPCTLAFVGAGDLDQFGAVFTSLIRCSFDLQASWTDYLSARVAPECTLSCNEPLAKKTTMRVGGAARFFAEPSNLCDLRALLRAAVMFNLETFCLGRGSNLIVPDKGFDGLVIRFTGPQWRRVEVLDQGHVWAGAGVRLKEICGQAAKAGLAGFEFMEGIPGSLGGSLRMNAGAMGNWMFDVVERVQMLDETGRLQDLPKDVFHFGYRKVEEISRGIALGAILKSVEQVDAGVIRERMDSYSSTRKSSQPRDPSAGCIFKNPEGNYAGKLIDEHGIKGMSVGAAEVSDVHGNFIVNKGGATASDVIELVRRVRAAVKERSGYELEPEVLLVGQSWDELLREEAADV